MKKTNKTYEQLREERLTANERLGDLYEKAANRELTAEEQTEERELTRQLSVIEAQMRGLSLDAQTAQTREANRAEAMQAYFRENLRHAREVTGTILLNPGNNIDGTTNEIGNIAASGAIRLTIHDMIPTVHEGLGLPRGLRFVTGVVGNQIWPVSVNDVEVEEVGEVEALTGQVLNFDHITIAPNRVGMMVAVSNSAIDNAVFDLLGFVRGKFSLGFRKYVASKIYSQAKWTKNKGPFSGLTPKSIALGADAYRNILREVANFTDKGLHGDSLCITMDAVTEAELKATPKIAGAAGGFVIEGGLCCGYPYTVSHYLNTTLNEDGKTLESTPDRYLAIGYWDWFAFQQHGDVRLSVDGNSAPVARRNVTVLTLNMEISMADLSTHLNGGDKGAGYPTQAFALYKIEA